jgi:nitrite reductase/ring-hydroxylating ferredoxin subunit
MLGMDLVAYRTEAGQVVVMNGRCSHLGADLGKGTVVGDCIQCPFHGWRYGPDGHCTHIPQTDKIPRRARQRAYPAVERHGMVFFFNGPEPLFPLPFFFDERVVDFTPAAPVEFVAKCTWFMVTAHGYDGQHFETVHSRRLHAPLVVDCPAPFARRSRYTADVLGGAYYDRLLRTFVGPTVEISITTWGGTMVLITGKFKRAMSRFMISARPIEGGKTLCHVVAFARKERHRVAHYLVQPLSLWIRRLFTGAYLIAEVESLGNPRYNPSNFVEADREMIEYFRWAATLPKPADALPGGRSP